MPLPWKAAWHKGENEFSTASSSLEQTLKNASFPGPLKAGQAGLRGSQKRQQAGCGCPQHCPPICRCHSPDPAPAPARGTPTCGLDDRGDPVHPAGKHSVTVEHLHLHPLHHILPLVVEGDLEEERPQRNRERIAWAGRKSTGPGLPDVLCLLPFPISHWVRRTRHRARGDNEQGVSTALEGQSPGVEVGCQGCRSEM